MVFKENGIVNDYEDILEMDLDYFSEAVELLVARGVWTKQVYDYVYSQKIRKVSDKAYIEMIEEGRRKRGEN